jgi:hypothetical protein
MNRTLTILAATLALAAVGCEEKKDAASIVDKAASKVGDAAAKAGDAVKDAGAKVGEKAGEMADKAKGGAEDLLKGGQTAMADKVNEMLTEWKPTVEKIKGQIATAAPDMKPQIESAVKAIETQWSTVEGLLGKLKSASAADLSTATAEAKGGAEKLGTLIKDAAKKFLK